jgi:hypothetical protein
MARLQILLAFLITLLCKISAYIVVVPTSFSVTTRRFISSFRSKKVLSLLAAEAVKQAPVEIAEATTTFTDAALTTAEAVSTLKGQTIVVKYGGNAMTSTDLKSKFCQDVAALQVCI